mmetsp:Transcript_39393/g.93245  ORF Transcript_39393/g.93245 Transcript_39393/m.93245 type:complete len:385 (+) Transcript_39393:3-1157(+)
MLHRGGRSPGWQLAAAFAMLGAAAGVCLVTFSLRNTSQRGTGTVLLSEGEAMQQQLALGQGYPYIRTPYADSMRPNGDMDPFHYPLYPYAGEKNGVHPLYTDYGHVKDSSWFEDSHREVAKESYHDPDWTNSWSRLIPFETAPHDDLNQKEGGQYQSPILPDEDEDKPWSFFGDGWQDHTYVPGLKEVSGAQQLRQLALMQDLHNQHWHTPQHSNNLAGMTEPIHENNPLGEHVVGSRDRMIKMEDAEGRYGGVVDPALRYAWDVFSGEQPAEFEPPVLGSNWDTHVRCEDEGDPSLCDGDGFKANPVSPFHTDPRMLVKPEPENEEDNEGVLKREGKHGVLPAGGGKHTYGGRKGDLIRDCTDPANCHLKPVIKTTGQSPYHG